MAFKILALRVNNDFPYVKNLKKNILYCFSNDYEFVGYQDGQENFRSIRQIRNKASYPAEIYNVKMANGHTLSVNTCAILGKNGAGKSTLLELFYLLIYCLGERKQYINDRSYSQRQVDRGFNKDYFRNYKANVERLLGSAQIQLFYELDDNYYLLSNTGKQVALYQLSDEKWKSVEYQPELFFYTICINYSLYGLNSGRDYFWLSPLFHKNDGYRTPLVLNPFRKDGVIDVNTELHLAQTRVLTNLVDKAFRSDKLIDEKEIQEIVFDVVPADIGKIDAYAIEYIYQLTKDTTGIDLIEVLETFIKRYAQPPQDFDFAAMRAYLQPEMDNKKKSGEQLKKYRYTGDQETPYLTIKNLLSKYCLTKIAKICIKYDEYKSFTTLSTQKNDFPAVKLIKNIAKLVTKLIKDDSHVTLKLKQAVNALVRNFLDQHPWRTIRDPQNIDNFLYRNSLKIDEFRGMIKSGYGQSSRKKKRVAQFIPTGLFRPSITLIYPGGTTSFHQLSSGEQQMIHSIHSIIYHILNIETLENNTKYESVNLVLDEIELYYHPDYQRQFIKLLLDTLSRLHLTRVKSLNVIFSTHSPFILSDISHLNVLKLRDGKPVKFDDSMMTFGSNIHEMLTDTFFLGPELIGAFAKEKIENCIERLSQLESFKDELAKGAKRKEQAAKQSLVPQVSADKIKEIKNKLENAIRLELKTRELYKLINMIGEPVVRFKVLQMYDELMMAEADGKERARREIQILLDKNGLTKNDL